MTKCTVVGCSSKSGHKFPRDPSLRKLWERAIGKEKKSTKHSRICSAHFKPEDYVTFNSGLKHILKKGVVPSVFTKTQENKNKIVISNITNENQSNSKMDSSKQNESVVNDEAKKIECRACLEVFDVDAEESLVNLFQAWVPPWDGMGTTVAEDLAKIVNIKIEETDIHSKMICSTCHQKLRDACIFTTFVYSNHLLLSLRVPENLEADKEWPKPIKITNINGTVFENMLNVEVKQEVVSDDEYGNTNGMEEDYLDLEIKIEPEEIMAQKPLQIAAVNGAIDENSTEEKDSDMMTLMNGNNDLYEHMLDVTVKEEPLSDVEEPDPPADLSLECILCTKAFNSVSGLKSHVIAQHSYKSVKRKTGNIPSPKKVSHVHVCSTCRRSFATPTDLLVHETCHNQYVCYLCNDKFNTFAALADHRLECSQSNGTTVKHKTLDDVKRPKLQPQVKDETLTCGQCNQEFSDPYYMSVHMEIHQPSTPAEDTKPVAMETGTLEDIFSDAT